MTDKDEILAAIAALAVTVRDNHADVMGKVDVIANGTGRLEAELGIVKADVGEVKKTVELIDKKVRSAWNARRGARSPILGAKSQKSRGAQRVVMPYAAFGRLVFPCYAFTRGKR